MELHSEKKKRVWPKEIGYKHCKGWINSCELYVYSFLLGVAKKSVINGSGGQPKIQEAETQCKGLLRSCVGRDIFMNFYA